MAYSFLPPPKKYSSRLLQRRRSKRRKVKILGALVTAGFIFFIVSLIGVAIAFGYFARDLPSPTKLTNRDSEESTKIFDRTGKLLYNVHGDKNRTLVTLDKIPKDLQNATIAIEDKNFYKHKGFDWLGMLRSVKEILIDKQIQGGSTLTQQLVKNALLSNERSITRKVKEVILSVQIERRYTKKEILQIYLNEIPYGGTAWGVQAAAAQYFNKDVSELTLTESAILAGLPQQPSSYSPFGPNPKAYIARSKDVLRRMREDGSISKEKEKKAVEELPNVKFAAFGEGIKAPHFAIYVKKLLEEKYGEQRVLQGGLQVTTTLDLDIQNMAQEVVSKQINSDQSKRLRVGNGAAVVSNTKTGEILALVGSKDYFATDIQGNFDVATQGLRQPGSALKPFNYLTGFEKGTTPSTLWLNQKTDFGGGYSPLNYDSNYFAPGQTRYVLANSLNIPAVEQLAVAGGAEAMVGTLKDFGVTTLNEPDRYGLALTLGGGAVKLYELTNAYAILGNMGKEVKSTAILKVTDSTGKVLEEFKPKEGRQLVAPQLVYLISNILSDKDAKAQGYGTYWANRLHFKGEIGVKTGTSEYKTDNWTFGYTNSYTVGTWVGNNDNSPMHPSLASGVTGAAPIYHDIMEGVLKNTPAEKFPRPDGIVDVEVDSRTGQRVSEYTQGKRTEVFAKNNLPPENDMYIKLRICTPSGLLASAACEAAGQAQDHVFTVLYDPYTKLFQNGKTMCNPCPPTEKDTGVYSGTITDKPTVTITSHTNGQTVQKNFTVEASISGTTQSISEVKFTISPAVTPPKTDSSAPFKASFSNIPNGTYIITVQATDSAGNFGETPITLVVSN